MARSYSRGWPIWFDGACWRYSDTKLKNDGNRPCARCGKSPTTDGFDACLGHVDGAESACCGHGVEEGYVVMKHRGDVMKRIYFLTPKIYTCPDTGKTLTRPAGYPSDGASGAFDIQSEYWKFHDVACDKAVWDDGTPMTAKDCSRLAQNCLLKEGRPVRAKYIYLATYAWTAVAGIGKFPNRPTYPNLAGETRLVSRKAFRHYLEGAA